jgi:hypothetical protein
MHVQEILGSFDYECTHISLHDVSSTPPTDYEFCVHNTFFNFYCFIWGPISSGIKDNLTNNIEND